MSFRLASVLGKPSAARQTPGEKIPFSETFLLIMFSALESGQTRKSLREQN